MNQEKDRFGLTEADKQAWRDEIKSKSEELKYNGRVTKLLWQLEVDKPWPFSSYSVEDFLNKLHDWRDEHLNGNVTPGLTSILDEVDRIVSGDGYRKIIESQISSTIDDVAHALINELVRQKVILECNKWNSKLKWVSPNQEMVSIQNRI